MKWWQKLAAVALMFLWVPCTMHCQIEQYLEAATHCCSDQESQDCSDCATCVAVESGGYQIQKQDPFLFPQWVFAPALAEVSAEVRDVSPPGVDVISSPPETVVTWQFSYRTALPPRAPSIVS